MKHTTLLLILAVAFTGTAFGHNGLTNFLPTVPDPLAITIDGMEDDWGWYDREFANTDIISIQGQKKGQGVNPAPDDFSMAWFMAWSPPPDNAFYFFARVKDDTLRIKWGNDKNNWWDDDNLNLMFDADHGGGPVTGNEDVNEISNGYRYHLSPVFTNEVGPHAGGLAGPGENEDFWPFSIQPHNMRYRTTIVPADAEHLTANVEYTFELKTKLWDIYDISGEDASVPHVFAPDQVLHVVVQFEEGDQGGTGQSDFWGQAGVPEVNGMLDAGQAADALCLLTADIENYPDSFADAGTAVEHITWARIKNHFSSE